MTSTRKLGLIVNPIAGMGGRVGLKGTDGRDILEKAIGLGAVPVSPTRAVEALGRIAPIKDDIELITYPYDMGEDEARDCGFDPLIIGSITKGSTTSADTRNAAKDILNLAVDLILFAGGDGTARDICEAVDEKVVVLGIPAGVKVHSGTFAINPIAAGDLALKYLQGEPTAIREAEVIDVDEQAFREDRLFTKLFGYLRVPYEETLVQGVKSGSVSEEFAVEAIASDVVENMERDCIYIFGPGTTTKAIFEKLGLKKTLLGVDVVYKGELVASDVNEKQLVEMIEGRKARIVVAVIGGQGFIFGRGSQQISPDVIRRVGREKVLVVATPSKLASLRGRPLLVDTGDREVDKMMAGYIQVIIGYRMRATYVVRSS